MLPDTLRNLGQLTPTLERRLQRRAGVLQFAGEPDERLIVAPRGVDLRLQLGLRAFQPGDLVLKLLQFTRLLEAQFARLCRWNVRTFNVGTFLLGACDRRTCNVRTFNIQTRLGIGAVV